MVLLLADTETQKNMSHPEYLFRNKLAVGPLLRKRGPTS